MKYNVLAYLLIGLLFSCTTRKIRDNQIIADPFTEDYLSEIRKYDQADTLDKKTWEYHCNDTSALLHFSSDTLETLIKYNKIADSIISDEDIYDLVEQTIFCKLLKGKSPNSVILLQQTTFSNLDIGFNYLTSDFIDRDDILFLYSQMTCKPFLWDQKRLSNVRCISNKEFEDFFNSFDITSKEDISKLSKDFKNKFGDKRCEKYSKPIFNLKKTFALISHSTNFGGEILYFKKENGKWRLLGSEEAWRT